MKNHSKFFVGGQPGKDLCVKVGKAFEQDGDEEAADGCRFENVVGEAGEGETGSCDVAFRNVGEF